MFGRTWYCCLEGHSPDVYSQFWCLCSVLMFEGFSPDVWWLQSWWLVASVLMFDGPCPDVWWPLSWCLVMSVLMFGWLSWCLINSVLVFGGLHPDVWMTPPWYLGGVCPDVWMTPTLILGGSLSWCLDDPTLILGGSLSWSLLIDYIDLPDTYTLLNWLCQLYSNQLQDDNFIEQLLTFSACAC